MHPFEIVGHRPGHPVGGSAPDDGNSSTRRNYLPIQLRRTARPGWADANNFRHPPDASETTSTDVVTRAAEENSAIATPEHAAEVVPPPLQRSALDPAAAESFHRDLHALTEWVNEGPIEEHAQRIEIEAQFAQCWANPAVTEISIQNMGYLTSLPPIPPMVTKLEVSRCERLLTPPALQEGSKMKTLSFKLCRNLVDSPDVSHCAELKNLTLEYCYQITAPPDISACRRLIKLDFSGCHDLAALPDLAASPELKALNIMDCRGLTGLLNLSPCPQLKTLCMSDCTGINELQLSGCTALETMILQDCLSLTRLPSVGHLQHLEDLSLLGTPLTNLPEDIVMLPRNCRVSLTFDSLSDAGRNWLINTIHAAGYTGPTITDPGRPVFTDEEYRTLDQEVTAWRNEAPAELRQALTDFDWGAVPPADHPEGFSTFLARVRETSDYKEASPALKAATQERVAKLLVQLQSDLTLREQCFTIGLSAVNSCQDQVAMGLMEMEELALTSAVSADIDAGEYDKNPQELGKLVELVKGQHRLEIIKTAANKKVADLTHANPERFIDPLEIHLGYITELKENYSLPVQIKTMFFTNLSEIDANDLAAVRKKLSNAGLNEDECKANNDAYQSALAVSPLMRKLLLRARPDEMTSANSHIEAEINEKQDKIRVQLDALNAECADFDQQNLQLMTAYHAAPMTIPVQRTLSILLPFFREKGIDIDLNDSVR